MKFKKAFTLIELLIVIAIIGIISMIIVINWSNAQQSARDNKRKADLQAISSALTVYYADNKGYIKRPADSGTTTISSGARATFPADELNKLVSKNYISFIPKDPVNSQEKACSYLYFQNNDQENPQNYKLISTAAEALGDEKEECKSNAKDFADVQKQCKYLQISSSDTSRQWKLSVEPPEVSGCRK